MIRIISEHKILSGLFCQTDDSVVKVKKIKKIRYPSGGISTVVYSHPYNKIVEGVLVKTPKYCVQ